MSHDFANQQRALRCKQWNWQGNGFAFAQAGMIALVSRSQEKLEAVVSTVLETGVKAKAYPLDLAEIEQVKRK